MPSSGKMAVKQWPIIGAALLLVALGIAAPAASAQQSKILSGEVIETKDVETYTYVRLKTSEGEIWAAVPKTTLKNGSRITIGSALTMENFESKALNRKFDRLVFGEVAGPNATVATPHAPTPSTVTPAPRVSKAVGPDARTVAEIVSGKATLKNRPVLVRGQVVKVSLGILGKNWLHLQDGSGSSADGSNDILVTTKDVAAVGDIVNAKGIVRTDVNLGAGYSYAVLVEDAAIRK